MSGHTKVPQSTLNGYHYRLEYFIRWCENVEGLDVDRGAVQYRRGQR